MLSSKFRAFVLFTISPAVFAEPTLKDHVAARELVELIVDRMELAEPVARHKWVLGVSVEDEKSDPSAEDTVIFKNASLDASGFSRAQGAAFKERQRQYFKAWKAQGVEGFDDLEEDSGANVRVRLEQNAREEMRRLAELRPVLCTRTVAHEVKEVAAPVLKRRSFDGALIQPVLKSLEGLARDDGPSCAKRTPGKAG